MNYTVVINCSVWGGALLYYFVDARKWFKGPKITLNLEGLTAEQEQALVDEGLEIQHQGVEPGSHEAAVVEKSVPTEKEKEDALAKEI